MTKLLIVLFATSLAMTTVQADCDQKYKDLTIDHTACSTVDNSVAGATKGVDAVTKDLILTTHNDCRKSKNAKNMLKLYWDDDAAMIAQKHAEKCDWGHEEQLKRMIPDKWFLGQNVAWGYPNWTSAMDHWYKEEKNFTFGVGANRTGAIVGHYVQMVWAETYRIGCGFATCSMFGFESGFYVCNYGPPGNSGSNNAEPYIEGTKTANCPNKAADDLCDCGAHECYHTGKMKVSDCSCDCPADYFTGAPYAWFNSNDCSISCNEVGDMEYCDGFYTNDQCLPFNVYTECAKMCKDEGYKCI